MEWTSLYLVQTKKKKLLEFFHNYQLQPPDRHSERLWEALAEEATKSKGGHFTKLN